MNAYTVLVGILMVLVFLWGTSYGKGQNKEREKAFKAHALCLSLMANALINRFEESHLHWLADGLKSEISDTPLTADERKCMDEQVKKLISLARQIAETRTTSSDLIAYLDPDNAKAK